MEREGTSKKCRPGLAHRLFEALDRHGQPQQEDQMAKKSKKGKKAKKAKKAVVAKKKSAKKASKKAAKKSAKKAAKKGAKKSAKKATKKAAKKSKAAAPKKAAKKSPAKKRGRLPSPPLPSRSPRWLRQSRSPNRPRHRAGLRRSRPRPHGGRAPPTAAITARRSPAWNDVSKGRSVHRCGLFRGPLDATGPVFSRAG